MNEPMWTLGIMVRLSNNKETPTAPLRLPEDRFCRALCRNGEKHGFDVFVFSALHYDSNTGRLQGYRLKGNDWVYGRCPLPDVLYDRCIYRTRSERIRCLAAVADMNNRRASIRLASALPGKLEVYRLLSQQPFIAPYLPYSERYTGKKQLKRRLAAAAHGLFLKPDAGMQGRGVIRLWRNPVSGSFHIQGRDRMNRPYSSTYTEAGSCLAAVDRIIAGREYLIQPFLRLIDTQSHPFDVRVLVQKNEAGQWAITGIAVRSGAAGSITANLHGGGGAKAAESTLNGMFGVQKTESILTRLRVLSIRTAERLEASYGRLLELGLDYGIEPDGSIWLLETNSKPGRSIFLLLDQREIADLTVERPLAYARLLCSRRRLIPSPSKHRMKNNSVDAIEKSFPEENFQEVHS
ncbi:YheC/YheD family endospore coat-associated protein [Paenibacillus abyssi]|uniref:Endospore coat-associated protein YheC n=1 Tax=Paenibacillus abyssi TaxID=1340531 RepID=A0A917G7Y2_9BACL|nr:YheC/YheD family protein [Paenibacillus abyssi]GGG26562.1 endospore coat-associated protein YheC [Paenibacillus abyssi]